MEWSDLDVVKKSFYKSYRYDKHIITIIKIYEITLNGVSNRIEMQFVYDIFGSLYNKKLVLEKEDKMLRDTFGFVLNCLAFIYPHIYTPFLKLAWIILIIFFFWKVL